MYQLNLHVDLPVVRPGTRNDRNRLDMITVQHRDVYDTLIANRVVHPNTNRSEFAQFPEYLRAYRWMTGQMAQRCVTDPTFEPERGAAFWTWARVTRTHLKEIIKGVEDTDVLLHVSIPVERILLTDFDGYHSVLNGCVFYTEDEERLFAEACDRNEVFQTPLEATLEVSYGAGWKLDELDSDGVAAVHETWNGIVVDWPRPRGTTQGCVAALHLDDLVDVYIP